MEEKLKERFCRDLNLPIKILKEPFFEDRLKLYSYYFKNCDKEYESFKSLLKTYASPEEYLKEYNAVKECIMEAIRNSKGFIAFSNENMNKFAFPNENIQSKNIHKPQFSGEEFVSIDMKKANFSSLRHYDSSIFNEAKTYEEFISAFTNNKQILNSKYIRQVIFGNLSPKKQVDYEKFLMHSFLTTLFTEIPKEQFVFFSNDEIILKTGGIYNDTFVEKVITEKSDLKDIPLRYTQFVLKEFKGVEGYLRANKDGTFDIKSVSPIDMPFVLRFLFEMPYQNTDYVFMHDGTRLSKLLEVPKISI